MTEKPYLDFYGARGIIPVQQNTDDLALHYARRRALYRHLGIAPLALKNRTAIELGPGTGDNALYTAFCSPSRLVLVDGNPASLKAVAEKIAAGQLPKESVECRQADILQYQDRDRYDFVFCEGVIPLQKNPAAFLSRIASFAGPDGIVVATTMSPASVLAESCRRILKPAFSRHFSDEPSLIKELVHFFTPDLQSLPGMSRRHEDWVLDNIVYPWPARCTFTIPDAIATLDSAFDLLGTSPVFIQDWRWYKAIPQHAQVWNAVAREAYSGWGGYLMDYRVAPRQPASLSATVLDALCQNAIDIQTRICAQNSYAELPAFFDSLQKIREKIAAWLPQTATAIDDFITGAKPLMNEKLPADMGTFRGWFGRGQQYVSFVRRPGS